MEENFNFNYVKLPNWVYSWQSEKWFNLDHLVRVYWRIVGGKHAIFAKDSGGIEHPIGEVDSIDEAEKFMEDFLGGKG